MERLATLGRIMGEPEAVKMMFACGPGMCDMDVSTVPVEGARIFAGGAEGMIKVITSLKPSFVFLCSCSWREVGETRRKQISNCL